MCVACSYILPMLNWNYNGKGSTCREKFWVFQLLPTAVLVSRVYHFTDTYHTYFSGRLATAILLNLCLPSSINDNVMFLLKTRLI